MRSLQAQAIRRFVQGFFGVSGLWLVAHGPQPSGLSEEVRQETHSGTGLISGGALSNSVQRNLATTKEKSTNHLTSEPQADAAINKAPASGERIAASGMTPAVETSAAKRLAAKNVEGYFDSSLYSMESVDFLLTPALLVQEAISDGIVITYPAE